jgi:HEAT repeat protein
METFQKNLVVFLIALNVKILPSPVVNAQNPTLSYLPFNKECIESELRQYAEDFSQSEFARIALPICGSNAVPALITFLDSEDFSVRYAAVGGLGDIGSEAADAIPKLIEILKEEGESSHEAKRTLSQIGAVAVPALIELLSSEDQLTRQSAAITLGWIGTEAEDAVPFLVEALNQETDYEYYYDVIAGALGEIGKNPEIAVPALVELYRSRKTVAAIEALGNFGSAAKIAIPDLVAALSQDFYSSYYASLALGNIGRDSVPYLIEALKNENEDVRASAVFSLVVVGKNGEAAVPALKRAIYDRKSEVRVRAAVALVQIDKNYAQSVLSKLSSALEYGVYPEDQETQARAAQILGKIGRDAAIAVPNLVQVIKHCNSIGVMYSPSDVAICINGLIALGNIGEAARIAVPSLTEILEMERTPSNIQVRAEAASALGRIGAEPDKAVAALVKALGNEDRAVRVDAYTALREFGVNGQTLIPELVANLGNNNEDARHQAALALSTIGQDAVPSVLEVLDTENQLVRKGAAYALGNINPSTEEVVEKLKAIVQDENTDLDLRRVAASSLELLGQDVQYFFEKNNLISPQDASCPSISIGGGNYAFFEFDVYTGRCQYYAETNLSAPGKGVVAALCRVFGC